MLSYQALRLYLIKKEPSKDLTSLKDELFKMMPEFKKCDGFDQQNDWHIYDVFTHILKVVDGVDNILPLRIAALFHDVGKPYVAKMGDDDRLHYYGHWNKSLEIFDKYKDNFNLNKEEAILIRNLIYYHDLGLTDDPEMISEINDCFKDNLELLFMLKKADILASNPIKHEESLRKLDNMADIYKPVKYVNH